jgi:hypothetical protein
VLVWSALSHQLQDPINADRTGKYRAEYGTSSTTGDEANLLLNISQAGGAPRPRTHDGWKAFRKDAACTIGGVTEEPSYTKADVNWYVSPGQISKRTPIATVNASRVV